jgi:hypothetical protein
MRCRELNEEVNKNISLEEFVKEHINENCDDLDFGHFGMSFKHEKSIG